MLCISFALAPQFKLSLQLAIQVCFQFQTNKNSAFDPKNENSSLSENSSQRNSARSTRKEYCFEGIRVKKSKCYSIFTGENLK